MMLYCVRVRFQCIKELLTLFEMSILICLGKNIFKGLNWKQIILRILNWE